MRNVLRPRVGAHDHVRADGDDALVTLVEFGDFQCPFSRKAYYAVDSVRELIGERMRFVFRHFPLAHLHEHALLAAEAAEAAGAQGQFWEMHDLLFEHSPALSLPDLGRYALTLNLDLRAFEQALRLREASERIAADVHSGALSGVASTPTFFIDGLRYDGGYDFATLMATLTGADRVEPQP